jgi:hypothetical protein
MYRTVYCRDDFAGHGFLRAGEWQERVAGERLDEAEVAGTRDRLEAALHPELTEDTVL